MLKKLLFAVIALVLVLCGVAFLMPRQVHVERSIVIERPAGEIYPLVNSFVRFNEWSPWFAKDPAAKYVRSGPDSGVGAKHSWEGKADVGMGSSTITASTPDQRVDLLLEFEDKTANYAFVLTTAGAGTKVTWSLEADMGNNPIGRLMGPMMDSMVGTDYETGLTNLKKLVESAPAAAAPSEVPSEVPDEPSVAPDEGP